MLPSALGSHDYPIEALWWSQTGSNRRPPECKSGALPAELWPRNHNQRTYRPVQRDTPASVHLVVGQGGLEPPTSPLSGVRSNQLSYRPGSKLQTHNGARWAPWNDLRAVSDPRTPADGNASSNQAICVSARRRLAVILLFKGGDPAAGSPTATLLRLHPSHESYRGKRPPCG